MTHAAPQTIYLADYTPPAYLIDTVHLTFQLAPNATRVVSRIAFRPNPDAKSRDFFLHGEELRLISAHIDGAAISPDVTERGLTCDVPNRPFVFEAEVEIAPAANTALEGLYMSNGMYCTQCEAEGFRKITYYPDRPDVMAVFTVKIESDLPVLLSNGNPVAAGEWHDPWPKPAYLFALVAGDLIAHPDTFTTMSGKDVELNIYVRRGDEDKCAFGMEALKKSMQWDEEVYGREYDLDIFNIVAVDDFNMGAMENKGLNIFNSSCVLASAETASDANFERIEAIIAHEYFHNWTGNRITCRDWFQLCLKEGLTVFRDAQFTGDMRGHAVKRIDDALTMRANQYPEDRGPLAHPVRPASFVEINNFYTATVYEKGAEVIGMLKRLVGDDAYYAACNLYFDRHDGEAATIEDWIAVFEDTTGRDLTQFARWYAQAGTPHLHVSDAHEDDTYTLTLRQDLPATPDGSTKEPQLIPVSMGLLAQDGCEVLETQMLELTEIEQVFTFNGITQKPILSVLRDYSAPVIVHHAQSAADRAVLLAHDTDPFNRWDAGRMLARDVLVDMTLSGSSPDTAFLDGLAAVLRDDTLDPAFRALALSIPSEDETAQAIVDGGSIPEPLDIHLAHEALKLQISQHLQDITPRIYAEMVVAGDYDPNAADVGKRALGNRVLSYISRIDGGHQAAAQYASADNMTQQQAALACLLHIGAGQKELAAFAAQWGDDRLVMDKWFGMQVSCAAPNATVQTAKDLTTHAKFDWKNPNRFRAVIGALGNNAAGFHAPDGTGYAFFADCLIKLDPMNPQTTARMATFFETWKRYSPARQAQMRTELERIKATPNLSPDTTEIITRILG
ncbi:MAG: aminopeptidase N [Loktanella sp.]|nr:aminopeptidase N [Loktanella sp.]MDO7623249.1 aminopeptidase N [Loktanella sp.]MDO7626404.1 aminopeptidase N [Loktanella sp.]MDO7666535.1 aminopeptidase N [Loktanella sp.]MDO7684164.1 aminopeptidase N [Loktanella sp.]